MDCGPTCLRMIAKYYGRDFKIQTLRQYCEISKEGASMLGIGEAAEKIGFKSIGVKISLIELNEVELPCILHWRQQHFVVLYKIRNKKYYIADPSNGLVVLPESEFVGNWQIKKEDKDGVALLLSPTPSSPNSFPQMTNVFLLLKITPE